MAEFAYNNIKNTSSNYILFKLNYGYYLWMPYKKDFDPCFKSKSADELSAKLKKLINKKKLLLCLKISETGL